jgi:hypothetical protein
MKMTRSRLFEKSYSLNLIRGRHSFRGMAEWKARHLKIGSKIEPFENLKKTVSLRIAMRW